MSSVIASQAMSRGFVAVLALYSLLLCVRFVIQIGLFSLNPSFITLTLIILVVCAVLAWVPRPVGRLAGIAYNFLDAVWSAAQLILIDQESHIPLEGAILVGVFWGVYFLQGKGPRKTYGRLDWLWKPDLADDAESERPVRESAD